MKHNSRVIGDLSMRFFSYIQLKEIDVVRTGEMSPVLGITDVQERDLLRRLADSGLILRLTRGVYLVPNRLPAGGKYSPGVGTILNMLFKEIKGHYQITGPVAFNFYGYEQQVPVYTHVYNDRISGERVIGNLYYQFIKVKKTRLGSTECSHVKDGREICYSSNARTLMDSVYDWKRFNSLPAGYVWIKKAVKDDPGMVEALVKVTRVYGNQAAMRRIGCLLETISSDNQILENLSGRLSASRSLIPFIPGTHTKGKINRKWGVILNG
jgi:predicted transcriptional regulator of viral defense system